MELNFEADWSVSYAAIWREQGRYLHAIREISEIPLRSLTGIARNKELLVKNTENFLQGKDAVHALLWGARGMGKSSLIKALLYEYAAQGLRMLELEPSSLKLVPEFTDKLRALPYHFIFFCDDLSFSEGDSSYRALKSLLEGSLEPLPRNILLYVTSNRRHLVSEYQSENRGVYAFEGEIHQGEAVEEKIALADRFPLFLGFYHASAGDYWEMVQGYFGEECDLILRQKAMNFATQKGSRSGRVAKQFYQLYKSGLIQ
ncbi:MAG: ATP-binding protein [Wolinella sp.]